MPPKTYVGLLITPTAIEAAQCSRNEAGEINFDFYHHMAMTDSVVDEEGDITNAEALGKALSEFWTINDIKTRNVVLGLSGKRAIARLVSLPRIPAAQLQQVVLSEAEQYQLFRDEEPFVDYFTVDADTETSTVFYAAASQKLINAYVHTLKEAKLKMVALDIAQFAALRQLVHFKLSDSDVWDGVIVMPTRLVITSWFGQKLLNWREVSAQRFEPGAEDQLYQFIETEVSRTLRPESGKEREIMVACTSLAESARIADYFQYHTDLPLQSAGIDYWARRVPADALALVSPAVLGLALWGHEQRIPSLDLLNRTGKQSELLVSIQSYFENIKLDRSVGIAAGISAATFLVGFAGLWYLGSNVIGGQNNVLRGEISTLTSTNAGLTATMANLTKQAAANEAILGLIGGQAAPNLTVNFVGQVNDIVPSDAWLTAVKAESPTSLRIEGGSNTQSAALTLAQKVAEFEEVAKIAVNDVTLSEEGYYTWAIIATIDPALAKKPVDPTDAVLPPGPSAPPGASAPPKTP